VPLEDNEMFRLEWTKSVYHNPIDGKEYRAQDGVTSFSDLDYSNGHFTIMALALREPHPDDRKITTSYWMNVLNTISSQIPLQPPKVPGVDFRKQVIFEVDLPKGLEWFKVLAYPSSEGLPLQAICRSLAAIPTPELTAPVKFQLMYNLWGFEGGTDNFT
jgi:hypothetical protein